MSEQDAPDADESTAEVSATEDGSPTEDGPTAGDESDATGGATAEANADGSPAEAADGAAAAENGDSTDEASTDADESLVERVAESDSEDVASEIASLRTRIDGLEGELDSKESELEDLTDKLKRKQADFQNYKKRMEKRREDEKKRATEDLVTRMLDVRDNLVRALDQDEDTDISGGVESTLRQFDDVLEGENVEVVDPEPGEAVDPHRHEVLVRVESDQPEGSIADVHRPGYEMADSVLREAQVTVSDGGEE